MEHRAGNMTNTSNVTQFWTPEQNKTKFFDQITKFIEFWKNGQKASFKIECEVGEAVMNMSVILKTSKKSRHSPS